MKKIVVLLLVAMMVLGMIPTTFIHVDATEIEEEARVKIVPEETSVLVEETEPLDEVAEQAIEPVTELGETVIPSATILEDNMNPVKIETQIVANQPKLAGTLAQGTCGMNATWLLSEDGVLTISGFGEMTDYNFDNNYAPWYEYGDNIVKIVIEDGITTIGEYSFVELFNLEEAVMADSVVRIGDAAFAFDGNLKKVAFSANLKSIGSSAFGDCGLAGELILPDCVQEIGYEAFAWCPNITRVDLPKNLKAIQNMTFAFCPALQTVTIPESVIMVGSEAFWESRWLVRIVFEGNAPYFYDDAFSPPAYGGGEKASS